jgi:hypothetical protein
MHVGVRKQRAEVGLADADYERCLSTGYTDAHDKRSVHADCRRGVGAYYRRGVEADH